jgi:hypothetical protein
MSEMSTDASIVEAPSCASRRRARFSLWGRFLLGGMLIWFGASKIMWPAALADTLWSTGFFLRQIVPVVAYGLPAAEIVLGLGLASSATAVFALPIILAISTCFTSFHVYLLISGTLVPCGCTGVAPHHADFTTHVCLLITSAVMMLLSASLVVAQVRRPQRARQEQKS